MIAWCLIAGRSWCAGYVAAFMRWRLCGGVYTVTVMWRSTVFTATSSANQLVSGWFDGFVAVNLFHRHFFGKSACFRLIWRFRCGQLTSSPILRQTSLFLTDLTVKWRPTHFTANSPANKPGYRQIWRFRCGQLSSPQFLRQTAPATPTSPANLPGYAKKSQRAPMARN